MNVNRSRSDRFEGVVLVVILLTVAGFAGAASFTHVKDWTLANSPAGTGEWFGWANAVISELVPVAALLTIRRRKRAGQSIRYPLFLLLAAAGLSLAAQVAVAKPGPSGWLLSAVPALAFMALVKLVLTPAPRSTPAPAPAPVSTPAPASAVAAAGRKEADPAPLRAAAAGEPAEQAARIDQVASAVGEPAPVPTSVPASAPAVEVSSPAPVSAPPVAVPAPLGPVRPAVVAPVPAAAFVRRPVVAGEGANR
jgi:hypothetical protein